MRISTGAVVYLGGKNASGARPRRKAGEREFDYARAPRSRFAVFVTPLLRIARDARREHLGALLDFVSESCASLGVDRDAARDVRLAVEEACMNLIEHGYPPGPPGPIEVSIAAQDARLIVEIHDRAAPFDPARAPPPDLDADWKTRRVGGLGCHLIKQVMDDVRYESNAGGNRLTLIKALARSDA
jgi:serine/threonine-protein kinase RsbW